MWVGMIMEPEKQHRVIIVPRNYVVFAHLLRSN